MSGPAKSSHELAFNEQGADTDDGVRGAVENDKGEVCFGRSAHGRELGAPGGFSRVGHLTENGEDCEMTARIIGRSERANLDMELAGGHCETGALGRTCKSW